MERIAIDNRWQSERWQPAGIIPDDGATAPRVLLERPDLKQMVYPGQVLELFRDEAEGYYLNVTSEKPKVFVMWRMNEETGDAYPHMLTLSYNEAARWMDAQEKVDGLDAPADILGALADWVAANYRPPEKKQRIRPQSFQSKEGRYKGNLS
jgi:hypothetical protein